MLEMRGGACWNMSSTVVQQGGLPRPLGGYQPNLIMEPRSPATPWHMHHTVKQEPADEERNDSGITSSGSDLQSSPGSENSQDLNTQNFPTSTGIIHQQNVNPYYPTPIMPRALGIFENNATSPTSPNVVSPKKQQLYQHLTRSDEEMKEATSPIPRASPTNLFKDDNEDRQEETDPLRRLQMSLEKNGLLSALSPKMSDTSIDGDNKSDIDLDEYDEQGLRMPKVNSHGKVKTFKCKQCDFIAITKLDFWEHSKSHIKTDKLLTCPKCPFVTEYKHHLEYHLRNHFGSKPFKCNQCSYSCVNKSMLNSHMKSHSNVYQYRCSDCSYATKYCHSLKLHLRKYSHKPAMVLNADGSPNPLPIIDVYGTRRGPKQKMHFKQDEVENPTSQVIQNSLTQFMLNPQLPLPFPYPFLGGFAGALSNPLLFQQNLVQMAQRRLGQEQERSEEEQERPDSPEEKVTGSCGVLDLSKQEHDKTSEEEQPTKNRRKGIACKLDLNKEKSEGEEEDDDDDGVEENEEDEEPRNLHSNQINDDLSSNSSIDEKMETEEPPPKEEVTNNNKPNNYSCQFCCISFGDVVLYTMHMGYHGYKDPFTCNMCGEQCNDKVSFFLHIARTSHS